MDTKPLKFFAQLYKTEIRVDGSARITLELGADATEEILEMLRFKAAGRDGFAIAAVPYSEEASAKWTVDPETGEVINSPAE
jgi:hypothetical protein